MKKKRREGERSPKLRAERERASVIDLPRCIIAKVLTYASVPSTHLRLLFPCKDESAWAALCASRFRTGSDLLRDWPAFKSWRRLYHVLECYLPMEGFYTLLETNPFGMLFRFSFQRGKFVGSMMFPTYDDTDHHFFKDVPIFELSFTETSSSAQLLGSLCVRLGVTHFEKKHPFTNWCIAEGTKRNAMIAIARYPSMYPLIIEGRRIDIDLRDHNNVENNSVKKKNVVSSVLGTMYDSMRVLMNDDEDETFRQTPFQRLTYAWHPQNSFGDDDDDDDAYSGVSGKPISMMQELIKVLRQSKSSQSLTFRYVNGPDEVDDVFRDGMPLITPGLYHGCYNLMYGKFRREVVLVYYKKFCWGNAKERSKCMTQIKQDIFSNGVEQSDPKHLFSKISKYLHPTKGDCVFVLGKKVTGDYHVTCDRLTFGALVSPQIEEKQQHNTFSRIRDRGDDGCGKTYPVLRRFFGFGTLSFPGFHSPHWDEGTLVQIDPRDDSHKSQQTCPSFAFVWGRNDQPEDEENVAEATVLRWVKDQDLFPFFSRHCRR